MGANCPHFFNNDYMNIELIGISGKKGSGKDALVKMLQEEDPRWQNKKFADPIKDMTCTLLQCTREQLEDQDFKSSPWGGKSNHNVTPRKILQTLGTEWGRNMIDNNIWVNVLFDEYFKLCIKWQHSVENWRDNSECPRWIISDVRFRNEVEAIKGAGGVIIRVDRKGHNFDNHPSETALDGYRGFDAVIENNGTLAQLAESFFFELDTLGVI